MLRISPMDSGSNHVLLRLEGRVAGPWVRELQEACEKLLADGCGLKLDLAEVNFVDQDGTELLWNMRGRGVQLLDCSHFVEEQFKAR